MELSPEILVLGSAAELANQTGYSSQRKVEIWKTAVREILEGLETDNNQTQMELWDYKLHALLFSSMLREFCHQQDGLKVDVEFTYFEHVFTILPPCPREVYYGLIKEFQWQRLLLECLQQLSTSEDVWLALIEDMLVYCTKTNTENCEILSAVTEFFLSESFDSAQVDASRKCSGPYMSMGQNLSFTHDPLVRGRGSDSGDKYQKLFQQLFACIEKVCLSQSCLEWICSTETKIAKSQYFTLFASFIGLGWVVLNSALGTNTKEQHKENSVENRIQVLNNFVIMPKDEVDEDSAKLDKMANMCHLVENLAIGIISKKVDIAQNCDKILWELDDSERKTEIPRMHALLPVSHFPVSQWLSLMEFFLSSQWTTVLHTEIESWDSSTQPIVTCVTVKIHFCHLLEKLNNLLCNMEKVETFSPDAKVNGGIEDYVDTEEVFVEERENESNELLVNVDIPQENSQSVRISNLKHNLLQLLKPLLSASTKLEEQKKEEVLAKEMSFRDSAALITDKLPGWEEHLDKTLSGGITGFDSSNEILPLLEENIEYLSTEKRTTLLFDLIQRSTDCLISRQKGWKILMGVFSCLPVMLQDSLISSWYCKGYEVVSATDPCYLQMATTVFNRLVKADYSQVVSICGLTLQNPEAVFKKAVTVAVKNKQQTKLIAQILQMIPMLCRTRKSDENNDSSLLCKTIHHFLATTTLQSVEEENCMVFIQLCLEHFDNASLIKFVFKEEPILDIEELLLLVILPYINKENMLTEYQSVTSLFSLKLFNRLAEQEAVVALQQPLVLLLCLCEMLQECSNLWDHCKRKDFHKREIITAIDSLTSIAVSEISSVWFTEQVCDFDLPVLLRVRYFLELDENEDYLKDISCQLWSHEKDQIVFPTLIDVLLVSSVDDQCLQASLAALADQDNSYSYPWQQVVFSLTQTLPNLLHPEWLRVLQVCQCLIDSGKLTVNYPTNYINYLPWIDLKDMQILLGIVKLLVDCCQVWDQSNALGDAAWSFVIQGLVNSIKEFCLSVNNSPVTSSFLLSQIFCQLCQTLSILPSHCAEQISLLMMKILTIYKGVKSKIGTTNQNTTTQKKMLRSKETSANQNLCNQFGVKSYIRSTNLNGAYIDVSGDQDLVMADTVDKLPSGLNQEKQSLKLQLQDL